MDKLKQLKASEAAITKFTANTRKTAKLKQTKGFFTARKQLLEQYWSKYVALYNEVSSNADYDEGSSEIHLVEYDIVECTYAEAMGDLYELLDTVITPSASSVDDTQQQSSFIMHHSPAQNLPRLKIPPFDGSFLNWYSFKDLFTSVVIRNTSLANIQRLQYLKDSLTGAAAHALGNITMTDGNFSVAWELLRSKYENKRVIINAHLTEITQLPVAQKESASNLRKLLDGVISAVRALEQLNRPIEHWDDWLVFIIIQKLDQVTRKAWELSLKNGDEIPTFDQLKQFLENRTQSLEIFQSSLDLKPAFKDTVSSRNKQYHGVKTYHVVPGRCPGCAGKHIIMFCEEFRRKSPQERYNFIEKCNMCLNCLRYGHQQSACSSNRRCQHCSKMHHSMLHEYFSPNISTSPSPLTAAVPTNVTANNATITSNPSTKSIPELSPVLLGTALVSIVSNSGHKLTLRALLDSGAEASFISEFATKQLQLTRVAAHIPVSGASGSKIALARGIVEFTIKSLKSSAFQAKCVALVLPRVGNLTPTFRVPANQLIDFQELDLADPSLNVPGGIDLILSAADYAIMLKNDIKRSQINNTVAQNTHLNWVVFGGLNSKHKLAASDQAYNCNFTIVDLDESLRKFWELEEVNSSPALTKDEHACQEFFENTTRRLENGRYVVRLPVKEDADVAQLASTYHASMNLLKCMERRLLRDAAMQQNYIQFMNEYQILGHMEQIPNKSTTEDVCYLPHHGVVKESSSTTKLRVVFNASQKTCSGVSLNDCLHIGPKMQNDLTTIVLNWRRYKIAFTGDIEKMYRQIWVDKRDADLQRILWRINPRDTPKSFRLLTVTYGMNCAPYLAINVLRRLASDERLRYPDASKTLLNNFYVDDVLSGSDDPISAINDAEQLKALLQTGGFTLRKWNSNSSSFLEAIAPTEGKPADRLEVPFDAGTTALGMIWYTHSDEFSYRVNLDYRIEVFTKRQLLSDVSKLFDPLGFLATVVIRGKIFFQRLWLTGLSWDDELTSELQKDWIAFRNDLKNLSMVKIPRWIHMSSHNSSYELHAFADASTHAYAAVTYLKVISSNNTTVHLLTAKTKVAPLKRVTIPRLELCAALLAAKLARQVHNALHFDVQLTKTYLWSDSITTLYWLRTSPGKLKEFVANRVIQIQDISSAWLWNYVPTKFNPADCASRGITTSELIDHPLWWSGPSWLKLTEEYWPQQKPQLSEELPELKKVQACVAQAEAAPSFILENYSTLEKLLATTAWCQRFANAARKKPHVTESFCSWPERNAALIFWVKRVQHDVFQQEIQRIQRHQPLPVSSQIIKLNPLLDADGILRLGGRLNNAHIAFSECYPIILPKMHFLTELLIKDAHQRTLHGGTQATLQFLRRRWWIVNSRTVVKRIIRSCVPCIRHSCAPLTQIMGSLPPDRCNPSMPFMHTGVDYAGPFNVRTSKGRGHRSYKGYIALFVCLPTKAIHLELVSDLTAEAFIAAFSRFISVRGICSDIYSDRGTNFIGANTFLKEELRAFHAQQSAAAQHVSKIGVNWHFTPPAAPNFGGLWEAGVKSMKYHLKRVVGATTLTFEEFYTVLKKIEACLNSRPLSALTDDPTDLTALTPGHFLVGRALTSVPESCSLDLKPQLLSRWKQLTQMQQDFWRRWSLDYLHQLHTRPKWQQQQKNIVIGQLVLLRDERLPPTHWALGRILDTYPGEDGQTRVVTIRTKDTILKRPISKVSLLPIDPQSGNIFAYGGRSSN